MDITIEVKVTEESGYESALSGLALNKKQTKEMKQVADKLAKMDGGHNKFLESIIVWLEIKAPRYWWAEADTYRLTSKQSESTMHTLLRELERDNGDGERFQKYFESTCSWRTVENYINLWREHGKFMEMPDKLIFMKANLPEAFLQKRMWRLDYKTLRNIIQQRKNHRLPHWEIFISEVLKQVEYPEFLK